MTEQEIAIALLPSLIERAPMPLDREKIVAEAYKFAREVVNRGSGK